MNDIFLEHRAIGDSHPPLVIVEIGINHQGSLRTAMAMVDAAANAGAEVIKHQTHVIDDEMSHHARQVVPGNDSRSIYDIMASCALGERDEQLLKQYVESKGMIFISTPFSRAAADRLEKMDVCAFKIGSGECNNLPLIEHIASFDKPMIISTGMNDMAAVETTVEMLEDKGNPYALMHTTNLYPTPAHLVRLGAMTALMRRFPKIPVGLSDHTVSNHACLAATALGASLLERHFTDSKNRAGPDIANSMDPIELADLIHGSETIFHMRGGDKVAVPEEKVTSDFAFASVIAIAEIQQDETLSMDNIWVKRPGNGDIPAHRFNELLGKKVTRPIAKDEQLEWSAIQDA